MDRDEDREASAHSTEALSSGAPKDGARELVPGARVGRYRVVRRLGQGGMGAVYLAEDELLGRRVALKQAHQLGAVARVRFAREARAVASLQDRRVASVFDVGEIAGVPYFAMEYVEGRELRELVGDSAVSLDDRIRILMDVAGGLAAAHEKGLVHRDVKPENVLVRASGQAVLIDFGIARQTHAASTSRGDSSLTEPGGLVGTPKYMSPEQLRGADVDARTDQFSWAVLAFELLTGVHPFASTVKPAVVAILEDAPPRLQTLAPDTPRRLREAVERALAKDRERRFPSLVAMLEYVAPILGGHARPEPSANGERFRRSSILSALALSALVATVVAFGVGPDRSAATGRGSTRTTAAPIASIPPSAASLSPSTVLTIAALPLRSTTDPAAAAAYRAGLQALEDNDWEAARRQFDRASELDPELAEAYVQRLVVQCDADARDVKTLHDLYQNGWRRRASLSERDLELLEAHEPLAAREPQDLPGYRARIAALAARRPEDVELALLTAMELGDPNEAIAAFDRILDMDADCANARQLKARYELILGRTADAERTLDACVARAPASQCLEQRVAHWAEEGACDRMERDAREWVARSAGNPYAYHLLANALAREPTDDGVLEALRQSAAGLSGEAQTVAAAIEPARLDVLRGRFEPAERRARALIEAVDASSNTRTHAAGASLLVELLVETGRVDEAARLGDAFLRRRRVWNNDGGIDDGVPTMLGAQRAGGLLTRDAAYAAAAAWVEEKKRSGYVLMFPYLGALSHAALLDTRADAESAIGLTVLPFPKGQAYLPVMPARALFGRVRALLGLPDAIPELERATRSCAPLEDPFVYVRSSMWLGEALEAAGDIERACAAYGAVLARWGDALPRARTAERAAARVNALRCARGSGAPSP